MALAALDDLDRRIVGALQVDGRATWRRVAGALGESFSTVTRRGNALLADGTVRVSTIVTSQPTHLLYVDCGPGDSDAVARLIADLPHSIFVYVMGSSPSLVAEVTIDTEDLGFFVHHDLASVPGIRSVAVAPILRYFRTVSLWRPGMLTRAEVDALDSSPSADEELVQPMDLNALDPEDRAIVDALAVDGRASIKYIADAAGLSETTARRRTDHLFRSAIVHNRVVVEPRALGFPVEAILWIVVNPAAVMQVGAALAESFCVRYAAFTMGTSQLVVNVAMPSLDALSDFVTASSWVSDVQSVRAEILLQAHKRSMLHTQIGH